MVAGFILPTAALDQTRPNFGGLKHLKLLLLDFDVSHSLVYQGASNVGSSAESLFRGFLATVLYRFVVDHRMIRVLQFTSVDEARSLCWLLLF